MNIEYRISNTDCRITNFASRHFKFPAALLCSCVLAVFVAGCETPDSQKKTLSEQIETLKQDKSQLTRQIEQSKSNNKELHKQINTLHNLTGEIELEKLYDVQRLKITKHSNLHDKQKAKEGKKRRGERFVRRVERSFSLQAGPDSSRITNRYLVEKGTIRAQP